LSKKNVIHFVQKKKSKLELYVKPESARLNIN